MIKEAIEKIVSMAAVTRDQVHGIEYEVSPGSGYRFIKPLVSPDVEVTTLDGLVELLETGLDKFEPKKIFVHVVNETLVQVSEIQADLYGHRHTYINTRMLDGVAGFQFNEWKTQESFIIGLQSCFVLTPDLSELLDIASHISVSDKATVSDTGVAQNVELKRSIAFKEEKTIRPRVELAPYRTFREVQQPVSDFIFRVRDGGQLALFEADGGAWKIAAMKTIHVWLANRLKGSTVGGLPDISIIS